mgnify:CR=1 FL=1
MLGAMSDRVTTTITDGIADVRLNRPDKMNALDGAMFQGIVDAGEALKSDPSVRVVVLSARGAASVPASTSGASRRWPGEGTPVPTTTPT